MYAHTDSLTIINIPKHTPPQHHSIILRLIHQANIRFTSMCIAWTREHPIFIENILDNCAVKRSSFYVLFQFLNCTCCPSRSCPSPFLITCKSTLRYPATISANTFVPTWNTLLLAACHVHTGHTHASTMTSFSIM